VSWEQFVLLTAASLALMVAGMAVAWVIQQRSGQSGWVDVCWTFFTGIAGAAAALAAPLNGISGPRPWVVAALILFWTLRLGLHIAARTRGAPEDPRYAKMRADWGDDASRRMFWLLQIQAMASLPLIFAVALAAWNDRVFGLQDGIAIVVFVIAVAGEGLADAQLRRFARDTANRGRVCQAGLWRWSRHPNYFFEWLVWTAFLVFAINADGSNLGGLGSIAAPLTMYWLLTRVSGIPLLEDHMVRKYGDPYRTYQRTTSAFFPMPPAS